MAADIEIEIQAQVENIAPLREFLEKEGVGKIYRNFVGYPFQLLFPDEIKLEEL